MGLNKENVLKIVGMHLDKTRMLKSVTQLESLSKGLGDTLRVMPKQRQSRLVKNQIVEFVNGFLRKKKRYKFIETDLVHMSIHSEYYLPFLEIRYNIDNFLKHSDEFWEYYQYYYNQGQHNKEDFVILNWFFKIEDPEEMYEFANFRQPHIYIKYEHMRSILTTPFPPTSPTKFKHLMKQVYTRSRTRGFFKPSEVDDYANLIVDFYIKKKILICLV